VSAVADNDVPAFRDDDALLVVGGGVALDATAGAVDENAGARFDIGVAVVGAVVVQQHCIVPMDPDPGFQVQAQQ